MDRATRIGATIARRGHGLRGTGVAPASGCTPIRWCFLCLALFQVLTRSLAAQTLGFPWKDGDAAPAAAGIRLGDTRATLDSLLGPPDSVVSQPHGRTNLIYDGPSLSVVLDSARGVGLVLLFQRESGDIGGLRIGDSWEWIQSRWGPRHAGRGELALYSVRDWTIWIVLDPINENIYRLGVGRTEFFPASERGFVATLTRVVSELWASWKSLGLLAFFSVSNILLWQRYRFWVPRYVHLLAALALLLILWLNWMWLRAGGELTVRRFIIILLFPLIVYFFFVGYGGVRAAAGAAARETHEREEGNG